jgi:hypothetical protein
MCLSNGHEIKKGCVPAPFTPATVIARSVQTDGKKKDVRLLLCVVVSHFFLTTCLFLRLRPLTKTPKCF